MRFEANVFAEVVGKSDLLTYKETSINGRKSDIKIPLEVSYSFGKMIAMLRYERGLIDRLSPKISEMKEFENIFRLGLKYNLSK